MVPRRSWGIGNWQRGGSWESLGDPGRGPAGAKLCWGYRVPEQGLLLRVESLAAFLEGELMFRCKETEVEDLWGAASHIPLSRPLKTTLLMSPGPRARPSWGLARHFLARDKTLILLRDSSASRTRGHCPHPQAEGGGGGRVTGRRESKVRRPGWGQDGGASKAKHWTPRKLVTLRGRPAAAWRPAQPWGGPSRCPEPPCPARSPQGSGEGGAGGACMLSQRG